MEIGSLTPYANNSRTHSDEQINQVVASMREFGFTNPILIDDDGEIIAGHCRFEAAKRIGIKNAPCITLSGLTEAQKKAYVISDNKLSENSGWNSEILISEINEIANMDFNIDLLGFDEKEMSKLFDEMGGVTISDDISDVDFSELIVKFDPDKKVEVMNLINAALEDIPSAQIWCDDE